LNDICCNFKTKGRFEKVKEGFLICLEKDKKLYGENHTNYAKTLNNLSLVLMNKKEYF
jgi:hypothetical protein